ncbi:MAG TPA: GAF domain-containing protein [Actinomycetota bacterium]|nr:GAF domain-containing protein [Actinomycetota bacterium]
MAIVDPMIGPNGEVRADGQLDSYKRLADVYSHVLSDQDVDSLLERIADTLAELVPYDTFTIYTADESQRTLTPVLARDDWADEIMKSRGKFGLGLTGWAAEHREPVLANEAHLDHRVVVVPGTPLDPEAMIVVPLVAREQVKGCLNLYRIGEDASFTEEEFELAKRFGEAAALALDNAQIRTVLEQQALSDSLTGLYNHRYFHERLRSELTRASRTHDAVALIMFDIDDFKKINDVHGHSIGDQVLLRLADVLRETVRGSDLPCRIGGEEFAVILPSCDAGDALGLASRLATKVRAFDFDPVEEITLSVGIAQGPEHAMNPRELVACADAAMVTAKRRGKNRIVLFDDEATERPDAGSARQDVRSIAHLKMLQSLAGKLNRLNDVRQIGTTIANELRTLIDYHSCRVYLAEDDLLVPIAFRGEFTAYEGETPEALTSRIGEGITGRAAETGRSLLIANALDCDYAITVPGTDEIEESIIAVPLTYGARVIGVVLISKLGINQFDEDDVRLLEVLSGHASVALENARLYEAQRREAENAKALLRFSDLMSKAASFHSIGNETVRMAAQLMETEQSSLWLQDERTGDFVCASHTGYAGDPASEPIIRYRVSKTGGERLVTGRSAPFTISREAQLAYFDPPTQAELRTNAIAPLHSGHGVSGWITVRYDGPEDFFTDEKLRLLAGLSYQSSVAMQKAALYKEQKESADLSNALLEFSRELAIAEGLDDVLTKIVELSARILGSPQTSVWLQELETGDIVPEAQWGYAEPERGRMAAIRISAEQGSEVLSRNEPFVLKPQDIAHIPGAADISQNTLFAIAPLNLDGRIGCIAAVAPALGDYEFSDRKMRLLAGVAHQAKLAITNAVSFESLERTFFETVEALANALEAKDEYTSNHARSITDMALDVGNELGIEGNDLKRLELGALFHDIGKIGIPSKILAKPGPLDDEEWQVIRTHPELGERILEPIDRLADVRPIVRHCHEHFDGSGYPDKISGDEIPIESRIILVVDAFDAMTTDRPYRKALPVEEACRRLRESSGRQFDPEIVSAFLRTLGQDSLELADA